MPALIKALKDPEPPVQSSAALSLGMLKQKSEVCIPALTEAFRSLKNYKEPPGGGCDPRGGILGAFSKFGDKSVPAVPLIAELAANKEAEEKIRWAAVLTLGELGPAAKAAVPTLEKLHKAGTLEAEVGMALEKITGKKL